MAQHLAALRALVVLTVLTGILYPLAITAVARLPGLKHHADGSLVKLGDRTVASAIIGQSFTDKDGNPLIQYFQTRPSAAGATGYDPTATAASNLGPEDVVDHSRDKKSLLTQVCARSAAVAKLEGVDGARPYCTPDGVGAVLGIFYRDFHRDGLSGPVTRVVSLNEACPAQPSVASYRGVAVECAKFGEDGEAEDYSKAVVTPVRGDAPDTPAVPSDAVTASGSGLDPQISVGYARLQAPRVAKARGVDEATVRKLIDKYTTGRGLGFMGQPAVNVVELNLALDRRFPAHS
jgi:K+-transporting ATPase ATPase C chain